MIYKDKKYKVTDYSIKKVNGLAFIKIKETQKIFECNVVALEILELIEKFDVGDTPSETIEKKFKEKYENKIDEKVLMSDMAEFINVLIKMNILKEDV